MRVRPCRRNRYRVSVRAGTGDAEPVRVLARPGGAETMRVLTSPWRAETVSMNALYRS